MWVCRLKPGGFGRERGSVRKLRFIAFLATIYQLNFQYAADRNEAGQSVAPLSIKGHSDCCGYQTHYCSQSEASRRLSGMLSLGS